MEHMGTYATAPQTCKPHHSTLETSLALFLCMGLVISYLPQIIRILVKKTSLGFSPYFLFLGATSSASSFLNVVSLQWAIITCCQWLSTGACLESMLGLAQVGLQWLLFMVVFVLFLVYYPRELRYERAITLTGPSRQLTAEDLADGYESDSTGDLDSLDSHIAENYSSFEGVNGQEETSGLSGIDESPEASGIASRLLAEEEDERSSSAFSRLVPTFWPVWKAPRKPSPLAENGAYAGEQLPANATQQARGAEGEANEEEAEPAVEGQEALLPHSMDRQAALGVPRELRRKRRVKRRTKEWGLALSLAWLVAFHFIFILLVTLLLVSSLPSSSFPPPPEEAISMGPSSRLLVQRWAGFLGWSATILAALQYIPQIIHTARARLVGSLSIPMMCLQVPGSAIFVYSLALRPGVNYTSLAAYVCTGILQGVLLVLCIVWRVRERRMGIDDYGRPLQTPLLDLGGQGRDR